MAVVTVEAYERGDYEKGSEDETAALVLVEEAKKAEDEKAAEEKAAAEKLKEEEEAAAAAAKKKEDGDDDAKKKEEEEAAAAEAAKKKDIQIPKFRFDAVSAKAKKATSELETANARIAELEAAALTPPKEEEEVTPEAARDTAQEAIDVKMAEAMKEGNAGDMAKLMAESRQIERAYSNSVMTTQLDKSTEEATSHVSEENRLNAVLNKLETDFPIFKEGAKEFNEEANIEVLELQEAFISMGHPVSNALIKAVNTVLPKYVDAPAPLKEEKPKDEKRETDVNKNVDTLNKQPGDLDDLNADDSNKNGQQKETPNALDLTETEFDALPEATKKKMRGDFM